MSTSSGEIRVATTVEDFQAFGEIVSAYVGWCRERYRDDAWFVERVFGHQSLADELEDLAAAYAPPNGKTLLSVRDGEICGGGAYRRLPDGSCEMKRLFVHDRFKGQGVGRRLCTALIETARSDGFELMRLDTGHLLTEAIGMYASFGFEDAPPHHTYPDDLMPYLVFMELRLTTDGEGDQPHTA
jgi:ribosomal protein S18 acetylase RimI-like enzyme